MFESIIKECKFVIDNAKDVSIDYNKIDLLVDEIKTDKIKEYLDSSPYGLLELNTEEIINFLIIEDALQFSFWGNPKWTIDNIYERLDGGNALFYSMITNYKEHSNNYFKYIENLTKDEFRNMLKGNIEIPLFNERYDIITGIAKVINNEMNGNFYNYIKNINSDEELFNLLINKFKFLEDTRDYNDRKIPFYKLGQYITSNLLYILRIKDNKPIDRSHLVGAADYKIPQVLRNLGVLKYSDKLSKIVDHQILIEENCSLEVEIRASMIVVIDEIWNRINKVIDKIDINNFLWQKGQIKSKDDKPYHLTRTCSY